MKLITRNKNDVKNWDLQIYMTIEMNEWTRGIYVKYKLIFLVVDFVVYWTFLSVIFVTNNPSCWFILVLVADPIC